VLIPIAVVVFLAIAALVLGLLWREESPLAARMSSIRGEGGSAAYAAGPGAEPLGARVLGPMGQAIGRKLASLLPSRWLRYIDHRLVQAGQPVTPTGFLFATFLVEGVMLAFGLTLALSAGGLAGKGFLLLLGVGGFGLLLPRIWLENRVKHRQKQILKSLPDAFDLITTCVEAGLGLDAALAKVSEKVDGPFAEELALTLREISLGKLRRDALHEMGDRTGVRDLIMFINAIVQAESMGTSIAAVLRVQAETMRTRRRQRAEQSAQQAPVKMVFPLVLCIFPTLFIIILGPAGMTLYDQLVTR